jgi:xanthine dehydrogenase small subunit
MRVHRAANRLPRCEETMPIDFNDPLRPIRFWFRGEIRSVTAVSPTRSVLQWLREDEAATGTKEGCGEGDCGACTVVIGSRDDSAPEGLRLEAVNSCIQFLPTLDGKALFTIEDLARDGELHPLQQAMVDAHASQCGFCTPGIVMSLWADHENRRQAPSRAELCEALSGNLCRCTGYRPILDAAEAAWRTPCGKLARAPIRAALEDLAAEPPLHYSHDKAVFHAPRSLEALAALRLARPGARLLAGSTDVGLWVNKQLKELPELIYLGAVAELKHLHFSEEWLEIGAAVTLSDAFAALTRLDPGWQELGLRFASRPVRNAGTLGGNVANGSPIGDSMPGLIACRARVVLQQGPTTHELPLEDFYLGYQKTALQSGEFIRALRIPRYLGNPGETRMFRSWKVSKRQDQDISAVCAAFALCFDDIGQIQDARIALGGMAPTPRRALQAERALHGQVFDLRAVELAMAALEADFQPIDDLRASAAYRMQVARNLLRRLWLEYQNQQWLRIDEVSA